MDARLEWLASLARDHRDASDDAREPLAAIPLLDQDDEDDEYPAGVWTCCGGKRWHTDDCDQGPTPNQILDQLANRRLRAQHDAAADEIANRLERHGRAA